MADEERLQDIRPLREGVQTQISELREEMRQGFRFLNTKQELLVRLTPNVLYVLYLILSYCACLIETPAGGVNLNSLSAAT
jgi:hypothetical protein